MKISQTKRQIPIKFCAVESNRCHIVC